MTLQEAEYTFRQKNLTTHLRESVFALKRAPNSKVREREAVCVNLRKKAVRLGFGNRVYYIRRIFNIGLRNNQPLFLKSVCRLYTERRRRQSPASVHNLPLHTRNCKCRIARHKRGGNA